MFEYIMELYLLRHAERGHGKKQDTLTRSGKKQAEQIAEVFKKIKIDKIICGTKKRTKETLQPLLKYQKYEVEYTPEVNEQELGILECTSGKKWKQAVQESGLSEKEFRPKDGENRRDAYDRAKRFYQKLKKEKAKVMLIVSHSGFISDLSTLLLKLPEKENINFKIGFCTISSFELDKNLKVKKYKINYTPYS